MVGAKGLAAAIRKHPAPEVVYVFPSAGDGPGGPVAMQVEAMRATQDMGVACVNGYSGYVAAGWDLFDGYRQLMLWLKETNGLSADRLGGLVLIGEPAADPDPEYDAAMRAAYPTQPLK